MWILSCFFKFPDKLKDFSVFFELGMIQFILKLKSYKSKWQQHKFSIQQNL